MYDLINLLNGVVMDGGDVASETIRVFVGEGNNQKLVQTLVRERARVELDSFYNRANFLWTQKSVSSFKPISAAASKLDGYRYLKRIAPGDATKSAINTVLQKWLASDNGKNFSGNIDNTTAVLNEALKSYNVINESSLQSEESWMLKSFDRVLQKGLVSIERAEFSIANHIRGLKYICRKVMLAQTIVEYCQKNSLDTATIIPKTYLCRGDTLDADVEAIIQSKLSEEGGFEQPVIVKPGEFSNRGIGISLAFSPQQLKEEVAKIIENRKSTSWVIVQNYLTKPLLYKNRKFDVRCYALVMKSFDRIHYYWYQDGYARTSSYEYDANVKDNLKVHLTNEAVQVKVVKGFN